MVDIKVRDLMSTEVVTIREHDTLDVAEQLMAAARIHHLPVVTKSGRLVGVVTRSDLLRAQVSVFAEIAPAEEEALMRSIPVSKIMSTPVHTVEPEARAEQAALLLTRNKFGCLPVVASGRVVGILTEGDFVELAARALGVETEDLRPVLVDRMERGGSSKPIARA